MKRLALAVLVVFLGVASAAAPAHAERGHHGGGFFLGLGVGAAVCCGYAPYYSPYYYGYPGYYYAPPAVVYAAPPPVTYVAPPATYYSPPATAYVAPPAVAPAAAPVAAVTAAPASAPAASVNANQASADFVDKQGRTCRNFQATVNDAVVNGTACLQQDGTWRTVGE